MIPLGPFLMSKAGRWLIGGGVLLLLAGIAFGYHKWTVHSLRTEVAEAQKETADTRTALALEQAARIEVEANRDQLRETVRRQNDQITGLHASARAAESAATTRAVQRLRTGERERLAIRLDPGVGPEAMNLWLATQFPR